MFDKIRALWVTNQPIGKMAQRLSANYASGTWMDPTLYDMSTVDYVHVSVASVGPVESLVHISEDGVDYYCIPYDKSKIYRYNAKTNISYWKKVISESKPDIIMIWGTEYAYGRCILEVAKGVPSVIVIQGILSSVVRFYFGGMSDKEINKSYTFRNFIKNDSLHKQQKLYLKKAQIEKEMIAMSGNVITENEWANSYCKAFLSTCEIHTFKTNIKKLFFDYEWHRENCQKNTILCTSPVGYPLKGFHNLLKALAVVKRKHKDICLRVPGIDDPFKNSFFQKLKLTGYTKYFMRLIEELDLKDNIYFLGRLSSDQMAEELTKAELYIVPSTIENLSMSMRESMAVGTPCIAAYAGGIPEILVDGKNGRLYRPEEWEHLAMIVEKMLDAPSEQLTAISKVAREDIRNYYSDFADAATIGAIYKNILKIT